MLLAAFAGPSARRAHAQVDCSNPDNLCTGDPCVIGTVSVASPCAVDFGARALRVDGRLTVPPGGTLSLTAASITVRGSLTGLGPLAFVFQEITLAASGDVVLSGPVRVRSDFGTVNLEAGANVRLQDRGSIVVVSQAPATVRVTAGADVSVDRPIRAGAHHGDIRLDAVGNIDARRPLRPGGGGTISANAGGVLTLATPIRLSRPSGTAGTVILRGAAGVNVDQTIRLNGTFDATIEVSSAAGGVNVSQEIRAQDGLITIAAAADVNVSRRILAP
jgi:hypothetical protein